MARAQGFARGDFDTSFPIDDKFLALRAAVDPPRYYAASGVYWHVAAAAWREVERKPASRICPDAGVQIADLMAVGLLDSDERLPNRAFLAYVGRARRQRAKTSDRQRQHREGISRVSHRTSRVTERDVALVTDRHNPARVQGEVGRGEDGSTGGAGGGGRADLEAFCLVTRRAPTPRQRKVLDSVLDIHDESGPQWAADLILAHPDDPIGAVIAADKAWRAERLAEAQGAERKPPAPRRRAVGLTGVNAELAALLRAQETA